MERAWWAEAEAAAESVGGGRVLGQFLWRRRLCASRSPSHGNWSLAMRRAAGPLFRRGSTAQQQRQQQQQQQQQTQQKRAASLGEGPARPVSKQAGSSIGGRSPIPTAASVSSWCRACRGRLCGASTTHSARWPMQTAHHRRRALCVQPPPLFPASEPVWEPDWEGADAFQTGWRPDPSLSSVVLLVALWDDGSNLVPSAAYAIARSWPPTRSAAPSPSPWPVPRRRVDCRAPANDHRSSQGAVVAVQGVAMAVAAGAGARRDTRLETWRRRLAVANGQSPATPESARPRPIPPAAAARQPLATRQQEVIPQLARSPAIASTTATRLANCSSLRPLLLLPTIQEPWKSRPGCEGRTAAMCPGPVERDSGSRFGARRASSEPASRLAVGPH